MGNPIWTTNAGLLGTIEESEFFSFALIASDLDGGDLEYNLQAGILPSGLRISTIGNIEGTPSMHGIIGVPSIVKQDEKSKFVVRITTDDLIISDRTFELIVTGQDAPNFITPPGNLGTFIDGTCVNIQILAEDIDIEPITFALFSGSLPEGVSISSSGLISGCIIPFDDISEPAGWDASSWDTQPWDFTTVAISRNYDFSVSVTDGKETVVRDFTIFVWASNTFRFDSTVLTMDMT